MVSYKNWNVNGNVRVNMFTIEGDGRLNPKIKNDNFEPKLMLSGNQRLFPSAKGWFKIDWRETSSWEYLRLTENGTLEVDVFCENQNKCKHKYYEQEKYWGKTEGVRIG